ncbi:MAG: inorganic phosphate transporter [Deltaproteobacteria bacterium]|jgi:PiT family inorganic phosphate transporter|nr:inorganic phosphate transporter [Deltaproteobacteria bacterium]
MFEVPLLLTVIVITALIFDFTNGAHDCANAIATVVSTKVLTPRVAVGMAAVLNLVGALLGTEVAQTLGGGIVRPEVVSGSHILVLAALIGAITWNCLTWYCGIPSSSSHALIGGLMGAALASVGPEALNGMSIVHKVVLPLLASPLAGFAVGLVLMSLICIVFSRSNRQFVNRIFEKAQMVSAGFMALSHGFNDAQKTMGVITLALLIFGQIDAVAVPLWVKLACALAMAAGTAMGGWRIVRTMGHKICKLEPVHGFAAETSAAAVISAASLIGAPISTTHTITACIFGVGSTRRLSAVQWGVAGNLIIAWLVTIPASAVVSAVSFLVLEGLLGSG